jgi:cytochrome bd-type quinol oxidase subunit 2
MPRLLLSLGAALTLWWGTIQLEQVTAILGALGNRFGGERALEVVQQFSVAGPIVATLGLALVGTAIAMFAGHRGDLELRQAATGRTTTFVVLTLAGIALPLLATRPTSPGSAVALVVFTVVPAILGLLALMALLARAAESVESEPGIPPARIV